MNPLLAFVLGVGITGILFLGYSMWQRIESEQRLFNIIQASPIAVFVIRKDHTVLYWNRALEELSRIRSADILGTSEHWKAFYKEERPCMADLVIDETLESVPNWYSGKFKKSSLIDDAYEATDFFPDLGERGRWLHFTASAVRNSQGIVFAAIETLQDITEQKAAEEELVKMKKLESLFTFARKVSQDFDSLLAAIMRNIIVAKAMADKEDKILFDCLVQAEQDGFQAKELTHKLISISKGGYADLKVQAIGDLLRGTVEDVLRGSDVKVETSLPEDLWPVKMDAQQIRQAFMQITQNALEAMPQGGSFTLEAENVNIASDSYPIKRGRYVKMSMRDSGTGIDKEYLSIIFEPYFTTKTKESGRGKGLGLAIAYGIVKNHNGLIMVESELGQGAIFHIYLPAALD
jgi:signal transduction histidine kinase